MRRSIKITSYLALFFGLLAAASCLSMGLLFYGMMCSIIGIIFSIVSIFFRTKYFEETKWTHPAYIALVLSTVPVIYIATIIFIFKDSA